MKHNEALKMLKLLSGAVRLKILRALSEGEKNVGELARIARVPSSTASQQLIVLRRGGAVASRKSSPMVFYSLADEKISELLKTLERLYAPK